MRTQYINVLPNVPKIVPLDTNQKSFQVTLRTNTATVEVTVDNVFDPSIVPSWHAAVMSSIVPGAYVLDGVVSAVRLTSADGEVIRVLQTASLRDGPTGGPAPPAPPIALAQPAAKVTGSGGYPLPPVALANVALHNTLLLITSSSDADDVQDFADSSGQVWAPAFVRYDGVGTIVQLAAWILDDAVAGTHSIQFTNPSLSPYFTAILAEFVNTDRTGSLDAPSLATNSGNAAGANVTSNALTKANELIVTAMSPHVAGIAVNSVTPGYTIIANEPDNDNFYGITVATKAAPSQAPVSADWVCASTGGAQQMAMIIFALKPTP